MNNVLNKSQFYVPKPPNSVVFHYDVEMMLGSIYNRCYIIDPLTSWKISRDYIWRPVVDQNGRSIKVVGSGMFLPMETMELWNCCALWGANCRQYLKEKEWIKTTLQRIRNSSNCLPVCQRLSVASAPFPRTLKFVKKYWFELLVLRRKLQTEICNSTSQSFLSLRRTFSTGDIWNKSELSGF